MNWNCTHLPLSGNTREKNFSVDEGLSPFKTVNFNLSAQMQLDQRIYELARLFIKLLKAHKETSSNRLEPLSSILAQKSPDQSPLKMDIPLLIFRGKKDKKENTKEGDKKLFQRVYVKNLETGKLEKAFIYLIYLSSSHFCFEMQTHDNLSIGQMEIKVFPSFLWIEYIQNFSKDLKSSKWKNKKFSFKDIGRQFIYLAYRLHKKNGTFIALKQGFSSAAFYHKFNFTQKAPKGALKLLKFSIPDLDFKNLYFYY
jgi:hypothetical protein